MSEARLLATLGLSSLREPSAGESGLEKSVNNNTAEVNEAE